MESIADTQSLETYHPDLFYIMIQNAQDGRMSTQIEELFKKEDALEARMNETQDLIREFKNIAKDMKKDDVVNLDKQYSDKIRRFQDHHFLNHQKSNVGTVTDDMNPFGGGNFEEVSAHLLGDMIDRLEGVQHLDQYSLQKIGRDLLNLTNGNAEIATMIAERFSKKNEMRTFTDNQISR